MTKALSALTSSTQHPQAQDQVVDLRSIPELEVEKPNPKLRWALMSGDFVAAFLGWALPFLTPGALLFKGIADADIGLLFRVGVMTLIAAAATVCLIGSERLYRSRVATMRTVEISRLGRVSLAAGVCSIIVCRLLGEIHLARVPVATAILTFFFLNLFRIGYNTWISNARRADRYTRSVLLIGANDEAFNLFRHFQRHPELGYRVRGIVGRLDEAVRHDFGVPWIGDAAQLTRILDKTGVRGALVVGGSLGRLQLNSVIRQLLEREVHVHMSTGINGIDHRRMQTHSLAYEPMVYVEQADLAHWQTVVKRVIDIVVSLIVLILVSPIIAVCALLVKLHDGGPVFFRQERVGRDGKLFKMTKLRSMEVNAEAKLVDLVEDNLRDGPLFKMEGDPRVTRIGRIMRATSIDELPQLFNVLAGTMSLVGPRPALPSEAANFDQTLLARQNVMPGITGLWQIEGRDNPDFTLYQRLDLFYVENWSVALDLSILLGTARAVLMRIAGPRNN